ncbi:MAG: AAA family ATPase [Ardenticatenaceae bacterium]
MIYQQNNNRPTLEALHIKNYRVLQDLKIGPLTEFSVFVGPNGSGKSTLFDVLAFLKESFSEGLRRAWARRGGFQQLRTRGASGPITIELTYRTQEDSPPLTYHLTIQEDARGPFVEREWLVVKRPGKKANERLLDFASGTGWTASQNDDQGVSESLKSRDILAASAFGQFARYPHLSALHDFVTSWHLSTLSRLRDKSQNGFVAQRLSATGDNLPNVLRYWEEQHPERLEPVFKTLSRYVPRLERVETIRTSGGDLQLQIVDASFSEPIQARFASDGTLRLLANLLLLHDPHLPPLVALEEPEHHVHPRLLYRLAEQCRIAADHSQLLVTTHSPYFVDALHPDEVWVLYRNATGLTKTQRTEDMLGIKSFMQHGALLGQLWTEGYFRVGDPLKPNLGLPLLARESKSKESVQNAH